LFTAGKLTDYQGKTVNFDQSIFLFTSRIAADLLHDDAIDSDLTTAILERVHSTFPPAFFAALDQIVLLRAQPDAAQRQIVEMLLDRIRRTLRGQKIELELTDAAIDELSLIDPLEENSSGYLRQQVHDELETKLTSMMLSGDLPTNAGIRVDADDLGMIFEQFHHGNPDL
jgi:ATP-dependent Clp protease ATP-binding subunit ClpA